MAKYETRLWKKIPKKRIHRLHEGDIVCSDALDFLHGLRDKIADIIFLDPPFNLGKRYGASSRSSDRKREDDYLSYMTLVLQRCVEVLREGGALYLYHIPRWAIKFGEILQRELKFRHWIAISMKNGFVRPKHLYPAHYALLYFTKGRPAVFTRPKIAPLTCRHCGEYVRDYGGYKKFIRNGINLEDICDDISPVRHKKYKSRISNELPATIPQRALQISQRKRGLVVDPFAGSGTTFAAAIKESRNYAGYEILGTYSLLWRFSSIFQFFAIAMLDVWPLILFNAQKEKNFEPLVAKLTTLY